MGAWHSSRLVGQVVRFGASTGVSAVLSFGLPMLLHEQFGISESVAVAIGFAVAYVLNILLLRSFVFQSNGAWREQLPRYLLANGIFRMTEYGAFLLLFHRLQVDYRISVICVLGISAVAKFFVYRLVFDRGRASVPG